MKKQAWFIFFAVLTVSCLDQPDCFRLSNQEFILTFRVMGFGASTDTLLKVQTNGTDSIFYDSTIVTEVNLLLNPKLAKQQFVFYWKNGTVDSVTVGYRAQAQFVSADCGQKYLYNDLAVLGKSTFDSIRVVNATPTEPASINIETFRCAHPDLAGLKFRKVVGTTESDSALAVNSVTTFDGTKVYITNDTTNVFYVPLKKDSTLCSFFFNMKNNTKQKVSINYRPSTSTSPIKTCEELTVFQRLNIARISMDTASTRFIKNTSTSTFTSTADPAIINLEIVLNR